MTWVAAVVGATGYAGGEVLRLLARHPHITIGALTAASSAGTRLSEHHPHLPTLADRPVEPTDPATLARHDVVVLCLPHGQSAALTAAIEQEAAQAGTNPLLVDCGADHRLTSQEAWQAYYGGPWSRPWTYGMPELLHAGETTAHAQRHALATTRRVAVPGCNVTAMTLATQPGVATGLLDLTTGPLSAVLAVGYSGAGKALKPHLSAAQALGSAQPYAVGGTHRHIPEVIQNLEVAGAPAGATRLAFTPVLAPMSRGILATLHAPVTPQVRDAADPTALLRQAWQDTYGAPGTGEAVVDLLPEGTWPTSGPLTGTGRATVQVTYDARAGVATLVCALDNLGKGTASAAIQSINLALGLPETSAVPLEGVAP